MLVKSIEVCAVKDAYPLEPSSSSAVCNCSTPRSYASCGSFGVLQHFLRRTAGTKMRPAGLEDVEPMKGMIL